MIFSLDFEKLNAILSKKFGEFIYDEFFEILIKICRIKRKYYLTKMSSKKIKEYLNLRSWLKLKFMNENYYWNFHTNEKSSVLPLNFHIHFTEQIEQEKLFFVSRELLINIFCRKEWSLLMRMSRFFKTKTEIKML